MESIKDVFKVVKLEPFCNEYTKINVRSGLYHRINGKSTASGKEKDLTEDDKKQLKSGLKTMIKDIKDVISKI